MAKAEKVYGTAIVKIPENLNIKSTALLEKYQTPTPLLLRLLITSLCSQTLHWIVVELKIRLTIRSAA